MTTDKRYFRNWLVFAALLAIVAAGFKWGDEYGAAAVTGAIVKERDAAVHGISASPYHSIGGQRYLDCKAERQRNGIWYKRRYQITQKADTWPLTIYCGYMDDYLDTQEGL